MPSRRNNQPNKQTDRLRKQRVNKRDGRTQNAPVCHALHPATRALPGAHDANTQENPSKHTKKQKQKQTSTGSVYPAHGPRISRCLEVQRGDTQSR